MIQALPKFYIFSMEQDLLLLRPSTKARKALIWTMPTRVFLAKLIISPSIALIRMIILQNPQMAQDQCSWPSSLLVKKSNRSKIDHWDSLRISLAHQFLMTASRAIRAGHMLSWYTPIRRLIPSILSIIRCDHEKPL